MNLEIIEVPKTGALAVFSGEFGATIEPLLAGIKQAVDAFKADVASEAGRMEITSFVYKLARSKTALDNAGKAVNAELKVTTSKIDANRRRAWDLLESWQKQVRKPLDDYEAAEAERKQGHLDGIERFYRLRDNAMTVRGAEALREQIAEVERLEPGPAFEEYETEARIAYQNALAKLREALFICEAYEAQEAENARLRAALREQEAREAAIRAEQERRDRAAARSLAIAEAALVAAEAESRRLKEAEDRRRREAEEKAAEDARIAVAQEDLRREQERLKAERTANRERIEREALESLTELLEHLAESTSPSSARQAAFDVFVAIANSKVAHIRLDVGS